MKEEWLAVREVGEALILEEGSVEVRSAVGRVQGGKPDMRDWSSPNLSSVSGCRGTSENKTEKARVLEGPI